MTDDDRLERADRPDSSATQTRDRDLATRGSTEPEGTRGLLVRDERAERDDRDDDEEGFLPPHRMEDLRRRWSDLQAGFVDNPRAAVEQAHSLVASTVNELTEIFTRERSNLEGQWNRGQQADTEELRVALKRYRVFFNRLLRTDVNG